MNSISTRIQQVRERIRQAAEKAQRSADEITLLAVSKTRPATDIREALATGQNVFGENYLQDALPKIHELESSSARWHFIGRIQSNKTRHIAENFDWVHSLANIQHARRLSDQRPEQLPPLNICLQVNLDEEPTKDGFLGQQIADAVEQIKTMPSLHLRGLMAIPQPVEGLEAQRQTFRQLRDMRDRLATPRHPLESLSMGMSKDLEAAILEGATIVRIGTAIFGPRPNPKQRKGPKVAQ